jgi:hypothetical protein
MLHAAGLVVASGNICLLLLSALPLPHYFTWTLAALRSDMFNSPQQRLVNCSFGMSTREGPVGGA